MMLETEKRNLSPFQIWWANKWQILIVTALVGIAAFVLQRSLPKSYTATASFVATSAMYTDKKALWDDEINGLYAAFGEERDMDRLEGIAQLDTTAYLMVDSFNLVDVYLIPPNRTDSRYKALKMWRKSASFQRTNTGELTVTVTDKKPERAANMANAWVYFINQQQERVWQHSSKQMLAGLQQAGVTDSASLENIQLLKSAIAAQPDPLIVLDKARIPVKPKGLTPLALAIVSAIGACLLLLVASLWKEKYV